MIAQPTTRIVTVCPRPHNAPMAVEAQMRRSRATIVVTATTWSASVAWRIPSSRPSSSIDANDAKGTSPP
jgi:hypothetical protein